VLVASSTFDANKQYSVSFVKKGSSATTPVGSVQMYAGVSGVPTGWLECNGAAVSRTTYASLFNELGTAFGAGNGTTTFALPNFQGRVPVGVGTVPDTGGTITVGATGGNSLKQITAQEIPQHTHPVNDPGHIHVFNGNNGVGNTSATFGAGAIQNSGTLNTSTNVVASNTTGITVGNNISTNTAISLMQPYIGLKFIIKY
jgi:hypothetical protein